MNDNANAIWGVLDYYEIDTKSIDALKEFKSRDGFQIINDAELFQMMDYFEEYRDDFGYLIPFITDDNSNYLCIYYKDEFKNKICYFNHEEPDTYPILENIEELLSLIEANSQAYDFFDLQELIDSKKNFVSIHLDDKKDTKIELENWFTYIGVPENVDKITISVSQIKDIKDFAKNIKGIKFSNFILEARNRLSSYLVKFFKEEHDKNWNNFADFAMDDFNRSKSKLEELISINGIPEEYILKIRSIWISFFIESSFRKELKSSIPLQFDKLIEIYNLGHLPCGWDGPITTNKSYDPIDFNVGKVLIW